MRVFATFVAALLISGLVAGAVQVQLGVWLGADLELVLAMLALLVFTLVTTLCFVIALTTGVSIDRTALWLLGLLAGIGIALAIVGGIVSRRDLAIVLYIAVPSLVMLAIQWAIVRRLR